MNQEERFKRVIFAYAESVKGEKLTSVETSNIIKYFNESTENRSIDKVKEAIEKSISPILFYKSFEHAVFDNIEDLLQQVKVEADKWDNK